MLIVGPGPTRHPGGPAPGPAPGPGEPGTHLLAVVGVTLKLVLVLAMLTVLVDPAWAHLEGKAPLARAVLFPLWMLAVPAFWAASGRTTSYPWPADILLTLTCLVDVAGNRFDLYDNLAGFDDWVHFLNAATVSGVYVVLTVDRHAPTSTILNAAVAAGLSASLAWELFEYAAFLVRTTEWSSVYTDTVGDLALGWLGAAVAGAVLTLGRQAPGVDGRVGGP